MNLKLAVVSLSVLSLVACGGGGDSSPPPVVTPPVTPPTSYTPVPVKSGDTYTFSGVGTASDGTTGSSTSTEQVASINPANGNYVKNLFDNNKELSSIRVYDAGNGQLTDNACTISPSIKEVVFPAHVGQTFNQTAVNTCPLQNSTANQIINFNASGQVLSYESITVPAGTFNTLKVQNKVVITNGVGTGLAIDPHTQDRTCWVDIVTGVNVKCDLVNTYTPAISSTYLAKSSIQLASVSQASAAAFTLTGSTTGNPSPYLYAIPGYTTLLATNVGKNFELDTTQPVAWSMITGTNTVNLSGGNTTTSYNGVSFSITTTGTSLIVSTSYPAKLPNTVNLTFKAALASDKTKIVTVNIFLNP
ncbi:hypothetical protein [Aquirhabdus sp.]|uniref:hypothetical protein n=1 Tax=Aquirhabdus sp. TaxID=2824160 RepID=UPI00396C6F7D